MRVKGGKECEWRGARDESGDRNGRQIQPKDSAV